MNKKTYVKPQILITSFEMSESIAAGCELIANFAENVCGLYVEDMEITIFLSEGVCEYTTPEGGDGVCYHAPSDYSNVFTS